MTMILTLLALSLAMYLLDNKENRSSAGFKEYLINNPWGKLLKIIVIIEVIIFTIGAIFISPWLAVSAIITLCIVGPFLRKSH